MPGLLDYLNNALGLLNRVGPMGTLVPSQMRQASLGDFLRSANDTAQGVSRGMSADLLGAPVDITAQLMTVPRYLGAQTPDFTQSPVGGSQWFGQKMESMGLLRPPTNSADEMAGRVLGGMLATPSVVGAVGSTAERGLLAAGQNAMIPNRMSPQAGAIVWHGSPHKFDKFDSSKIGTGEGAQAYGHGLYFAENPKVAEGYRYVHGGGVPAVDAFSYMGKDVEHISGVGRAALRSGSAADSGMSVGLRGFPPDGAKSSIANFGVGATPAKLKDVFPDFSRQQIDALQALVNSRGDKDKAISMLTNKGRLGAAKIAEETADQFKVNKMAGSDTHLYKVDLPDDQIAKMLDWDKPLSQQPELKKALQNFNNEYGLLGQKSLPENLTGKQIYQAIENAIANMSAEGVKRNVSQDVSGLLKQYGIPGIRYLDGGSRGAGDGTRNYVVFPGNEDLLKILERQ